jgi:demethylmenaquinone methyltransferase/2-methoxy-6-polyprenyl-1,4-benzoquinol methylase
MQAYYAARAKEYERIFAKPERQADLRELERLIPASLRGRRVIEIACGTGYWTQHIAPVASFVFATDLTAETLEVARSKGLPAGKVELAIADAFDLPVTAGPFSGAYAGFWWSHVRHGQCRPFLQSLHKGLGPGARVVFMDNRYVEGSSTPLSRTDAEGNTYQLRTLDNGETHEVLKNFPTEAGLLREIEGFGVNGRYTALEHYWLFEYDAR